MTFVRSQLSRRRAVGSFGVAALGLTLTACGVREAGRGQDPARMGDVVDFSPRFASFVPAEEPNGDLAKVSWPEWMAQLDPEITRLYEFQILNGPLMRYMPCFCGCHVQDGHQNNRDCYVDTVNPDGSVIFDSMAPT